MKILIVEDDFASRTILQKLTARYGESHGAASGGEAIKAFKGAFEAGEPYDAVLLDIMMPRMDGHEVLKRIREFEEKKGVAGLSGVKVVMVTALDDFDNIMKGFKGQCEGYLVKPVSEEKLEKCFTELKLI